MKKIEIKNRFTNEVIYTYESENATIKDAVEKAIKEKFSLSSADLRSADLSSANLYSAENKDTAYLPLFCKWMFSILGDKIRIGCEERTIKDWDLFFASDKVINTKRNTDDFKQIEAVYNACKAYLLTLNS
jgi:hypothetical protein